MSSCPSWLRALPAPPAAPLAARVAVFPAICPSCCAQPGSFEMSMKPTTTTTRRRIRPPAAPPRLFRGTRIGSGEQLAGRRIDRRLGRAARGDDAPGLGIGALPAEFDVVAALDHDDGIDREHETDEQHGKGNHGP